MTGRRARSRAPSGQPQPHSFPDLLPTLFVYKPATGGGSWSLVTPASTSAVGAEAQAYFLARLNDTKTSVEAALVMRLIELSVGWRAVQGGASGARVGLELALAKLRQTGLAAVKVPPAASPHIPTSKATCAAPTRAHKRPAADDLSDTEVHKRQRTATAAPDRQPSRTQPAVLSPTGSGTSVGSPASLTPSDMSSGPSQPTRSDTLTHPTRPAGAREAGRHPAAANCHSLAHFPSEAELCPDLYSDGPHRPGCACLN